jgi:cell division protein FtsB
MMQSATNLWQQKPDQLLERVMERAKTLLTAERTALSQQVDSSRQAAMAAVILTQSQTIDDLTAACATLHDAIDDLTATCATLQDAIDAARATLHDAHAPLLAELRAAQVELAKLHGSTSWRLTRPLRSLRQRLRPA